MNHMDSFLTITTVVLLFYIAVILSAVLRAINRVHWELERMREAARTDATAPLRRGK